MNKEQAQETLKRTLSNASIDAFVLSFIFGMWGAQHLITGTSTTETVIGVIMVVSSGANFFSGFQRRALARSVEVVDVEGT